VRREGATIGSFGCAILDSGGVPRGRRNRLVRVINIAILHKRTQKALANKGSSMLRACKRTDHSAWPNGRPEPFAKDLAYRKSQKQTHYSATPNGRPERFGRDLSCRKSKKQSHYSVSSDSPRNAPRRTSTLSIQIAKCRNEPTAGATSPPSQYGRVGCSFRRYQTQDGIKHRWQVNENGNCGGGASGARKY
jgi:hypothetical protein